MTVTLFDEIHQNRQGSSEGLAKTTSSRSWRVVTNNRYDDDVFVIRYGLSSNLLPQLYSPHPSWQALTARKVTASNQADSPHHFLVTVEYSSAPLDQEDKEKEENPDPTTRPAVIKWNTVLYREAVEKDVDGDAILNSAGDYFDPPIERDRSNWTCVVRKNMANPPTWLLDYNNCPINSSSFTVDGVQVQAQKARLSMIDIGEKQVENDVNFRTVTITLEFKKEGWQASILDQGLKERQEGPAAAGAGATPLVAIQVDGKAITSPQLLSSGRHIESPTPQNAEFINYDIYDSKDFSVLPLT
jgi:hypothetical protein